MLEQLSNPEIWYALVSLTAMEIVLGIDNIVFISILVGRLPPEKRGRARKIGIAMALITRLGLLTIISWIMGLERPLIEVMGRSFSGKQLILIGGGLFLLGKATLEIHNKLEGGGEHSDAAGSRRSALLVIIQIMVIDIVFSLDSVITAVGMAPEIWIMVVAMVVAVGVMLAASGFISEFVDRHPSVKILALSFLLLIGVMLIAEGFGEKVDKGYIYFAMGFSLFVELLNIKRSKGKPVQLHTPFENEPAATRSPTPGS